MNDANWLLNWYMTPCTPRRIIPLGVATYVEYACVGLSGLGILGFIAYAIKAAADAIAKRRFVPCPALPCLAFLLSLGSAQHRVRMQKGSQPIQSINQQQQINHPPPKPRTTAPLLLLPLLPRQARRSRCRCPRTPPWCSASCASPRPARTTFSSRSTPSPRHVRLSSHPHFLRPDPSACLSHPPSSPISPSYPFLLTPFFKTNTPTTTPHPTPPTGRRGPQGRAALRADGGGGRPRRLHPPACHPGRRGGDAPQHALRGGPHALADPAQGHGGDPPRGHPPRRGRHHAQGPSGPRLGLRHGRLPLAVDGTAEALPSLGSLAELNFIGPKRRPCVLVGSTRYVLTIHHTTRPLPRPFPFAACTHPSSIYIDASIIMDLSHPQPRAASPASPRTANPSAGRHPCSYIRLSRAHTLYWI